MVWRRTGGGGMAGVGGAGLGSCAAGRRRSRLQHGAAPGRPCGALSRLAQQVAGRLGLKHGRPGGRRCKNASICCRPSALKTEQVAYSSRPPGRQQRPQRVQHLGLDAGQRGDVVGPAQPAHVGVAAHDARRVQGASSRMASKGRPSHQPRGSRGVAGRSVARSCRRFRVSCTRARRCGSAVQRQHVQIGQLQQVGRLAAGAAQASSTRAPGGQPAAPAAQQQRRGALGGGVLHRHLAFGKAGQLLHRAGLVQHHRLAARPGRPAAWRHARCAASRCT
jgi:hypothetical protein